MLLLEELYTKAYKEKLVELLIKLYTGETYFHGGRNLLLVDITTVDIIFEVNETQLGVVLSFTHSSPMNTPKTTVTKLIEEIKQRFNILVFVDKL